MVNYTPKKIIIGFLPLIIILIIGIPLIIFADEPKINLTALIFNISFLIILFFIMLSFLYKKLSVNFVKFTWFILFPGLLSIASFVKILTLSIIIFLLVLIMSFIIYNFQIKNKFEQIKNHQEKVLLTTSLIHMVVGYILFIIILKIIEFRIHEDFIQVMILMIFPIIFANMISFNLALIINHKYSEFYEFIDVILAENKSL